MPGTVCNKNNKGVKKAGPSGSGSWSFTFRAVKPSPGWTYGGLRGCGWQALCGCMGALPLAGRRLAGGGPSICALQAPPCTPPALDGRTKLLPFGCAVLAGCYIQSGATTHCAMGEPSPPGLAWASCTGMPAPPAALPLRLAAQPAAACAAHHAHPHPALAAAAACRPAPAGDREAGRWAQAQVRRLAAPWAASAHPMMGCWDSVPPPAMSMPAAGTRT